MPAAIAGVHHGCGHDGHTAMLLGAARQLARTRRFDGTVHFIFQPAEEGRGGARVMVEQGLFERFPCDAVYALHNWPDLPLGHAQTRPGPIMAAADRFDIVLRGRGGHAAQPHRTPDVLLAASQLVAQLNTIVSRRIDPAESAVLSVTHVHGGSSHNVLPAEATVTGTVRSFDAQAQDRIEAALRDAAAGIALAHGVEADVTYHRYYPATVNSAAEAQLALRAAEVAGLKASVAPRPAFTSEDFAFMVRAAARRLPLARPGRRRTPAAPPLLRLQRRRAAARRALVLRGGRDGACRVMRPAPCRRRTDDCGWSTLRRSHAASYAIAFKPIEAICALGHTAAVVLAVDERKSWGSWRLRVSLHQRQLRGAPAPTVLVHSRTFNACSDLCDQRVKSLRVPSRFEFDLATDDGRSSPIHDHALPHGVADHAEHRRLPKVWDLADMKEGELMGVLPGQGSSLLRLEPITEMVC